MIRVLTKVSFEFEMYSFDILTCIKEQLDIWCSLHSVLLVFL